MKKKTIVRLLIVLIIVGALLAVRFVPVETYHPKDSCPGKPVRLSIIRHGREELSKQKQSYASQVESRERMANSSSELERRLIPSCILTPEYQLYIL